METTRVRTAYRIALVMVGGIAACAPGPEPLSTEQALGEISLDLFLEHMNTLSGDAMSGRRPGTAGYDSAAAYVARAAESLGLEPGGADGSYFQPITFRTAVIDGCLRKDVRERTPTAGAVRDALRKFSRPERRVKPLHVLAMALVSLIVIVTVMIMISTPDSDAEHSTNVGDEQPPMVVPPKLETPQLPRTADELIPDRWNKLLDRPVATLYRSGTAETLRVVTDTDLETVSVISDGPSLLHAGECPFSDFLLRVDLSQPGWTGQFGLFWGLSETDDGFLCERLIINRQNDGFGKGSFRLDRDVIQLSADYQPRAIIGRASAKIEAPGESETLELDFAGGRVARIRIDEEAATELVGPPPAHVPIVTAQGRIGLPR